MPLSDVLSDRPVRRHLRGWTYITHVLLERVERRHGEEAVKELKKNGGAMTIKHKDRYMRYVNLGWVTATGNRPLVLLYRRFRKGATPR